MSKIMNAFWVIVTAFAFGIALVSCSGRHHQNAESPETVVAKAPTASDQSRTGNDVDLVKRIRESVMSDQRLSSLSKYLAIIAINGQVTLRGQVMTVAQKAEIGTRAREIAGIDQVENNLDVTGH